jgi:hypothetical protein
MHPIIHAFNCQVSALPSIKTPRAAITHILLPRTSPSVIKCPSLLQLRLVRVSSPSPLGPMAPFRGPSRRARGYHARLRWPQALRLALYLLRTTGALLSFASTAPATSLIQTCVSVRSGSVDFSLTGSKNSNIVQLFSMLRKDNPQEQLVYYQVAVDCGYLYSLSSYDFTRLELAHTRSRRSPRPWQRDFRSMLIWPSRMISMRTLWVRVALLPLLKYIQLTVTHPGGYEFLMQNCTPLRNLLFYGILLLKLQIVHTTRSVYLVSLAAHIRLARSLEWSTR